MNRITWHHTGGGYKPNATDLRSYHRLIDGDGRVHPGVHPISANAPGASMAAGTYAAHTRGLNRGAIGVSVCSMVGGTWENPRSSRAFPRPVQLEALVRETVALCRQYNIRPVREHVLSHAEVELTLGVKQRNKWDFDYQVLTVARRNPIAIGDEIRREVVLQLGGRHRPRCRDPTGRARHQGRRRVRPADPRCCRKLSEITRLAAGRCRW
jgi:hypothetical protein